MKLQLHRPRTFMCVRPCRDLARQVLQWMTDPSDAQLAAAACRLIRAFPIALMASLRTDHDLKRGKQLPLICMVLLGGPV